MPPPTITASKPRTFREQYSSQSKVCNFFTQYRWLAIWTLLAHIWAFSSSWEMIRPSLHVWQTSLTAAAAYRDERVQVYVWQQFLSCVYRRNNVRFRIRDFKLSEDGSMFQMLMGTLNYHEFPDSTIMVQGYVKP